MAVHRLALLEELRTEGQSVIVQGLILVAKLAKSFDISDSPKVLAIRRGGLTLLGPPIEKYWAMRRERLLQS